MSKPVLPAVPEIGGLVLGVGTDLVHVPGFAEQLSVAGTVFGQDAFSPRERREAQRRESQSGSYSAEHLAARWAAKEAFVKAWSQAVSRTRGSGSPVLRPEAVTWREIEVVNDHWGRPSLRLSGSLARAVEDSLGPGASQPEHWAVSLTHDGGWAAAVVVATSPPQAGMRTFTRLTTLPGDTSNPEQP